MQAGKGQAKHYRAEAEHSSPLQVDRAPLMKSRPRSSSTALNSLQMNNNQMQQLTASGNKNASSKQAAQATNKQAEATGRQQASNKQATSRQHASNTQETSKHKQPSSTSSQQAGNKQATAAKRVAKPDSRQIDEHQRCPGVVASQPVPRIDQLQPGKTVRKTPNSKSERRAEGGHQKASEFQLSPAHSRVKFEVNQATQPGGTQSQARACLL